MLPVCLSPVYLSYLYDAECALTRHSRLAQYRLLPTPVTSPADSLLPVTCPVWSRRYSRRRRRHYVLPVTVPVGRLSTRCTPRRPLHSALLSRRSLALCCEVLTYRWLPSSLEHRPTRHSHGPLPVSDGPPRCVFTWRQSLLSELARRHRATVYDRRLVSVDGRLAFHTAQFVPSSSSSKDECRPASITTPCWSCRRRRRRVARRRLRYWSSVLEPVQSVHHRPVPVQVPVQSRSVETTAPRHGLCRRVVRWASLDQPLTTAPSLRGHHAQTTYTNRRRLSN